MNRRVLPLIIGSLLLPQGCGGNDEPTGPSFSTLSVTTTSLPNAAPSVAYSETLAATGGDSDYTWSVTVGSLPTGLSLATNGAITGTPTGASSTFTVEATSGDGQTATQQLTITINVAITTTSLPNAAETLAYSETLEAIGGDGSYTWSLTVGSLPTGLSLNTSTSDITGTPTGARSTFTVQVESGDGQTATQELRITVDPYCSVQPASAIPTFEDWLLEKAIRSALSIGFQDALTCNLLSSMTELNATNQRSPHAGIASLVGIQNLTGLANLSLSYNEIITDISVLSGLTSLTNLSLGGNNIRDISALSGLTSLTYLSLGENEIITDISVLSGLTGLTDLRLHVNSITDISALSGLTSLTSLSLSTNSITDISALSGLTILTFLSLGGNSFTDISALSGLTSLTELHLGGNSITDISALSGLPSLTSLWLYVNSITDISALSGLTSLTFLGLSTNSITDISALTSLTELGLGGNSITDVSTLSGLAGLTSLGLYDNSITDISALSGLTSLTFLYLFGNSITDISALSGPTSLGYVSLINNPDLSNIQPLLDNTGLGAGDRVLLSGTMVSCADVAALQAKGVRVFSDCP